MSILKPAKHTLAYFKAGIFGFDGSGKTYTATLLAIGICKLIKNLKIAFMDTETGSDFLLKKLEEEEFKKENIFQVKSRSFSDCLTFIQDCENEKIGVGIIDSITHIWRELCESYAEKLHRKSGRLEFQDWNIIKKEWSEYTKLFVNSKLHLIVCGRGGFEWEYDYNEDGTKDLVKAGTKMKVENEFGYEPSLIIEMERLTQDKETLAKLKERTAKQSFKPKVGSLWIHRAHILKDRTDVMDGQIFDYPTFDNFIPHFQALNIGGEHLGIDLTRTSQDRFDIEGKPEWKKEKEQAEICLEEIQGELTLTFPSTSGAEKIAKIRLLEYVFNTKSWKQIEDLKYNELKTGHLKIKAILNIQSNVDLLLSSPDEYKPENIILPINKPELLPEQFYIKCAEFKKLIKEEDYKKVLKKYNCELESQIMPSQYNDIFQEFEAIIN